MYIHMSKSGMELNNLFSCLTLGAFRSGTAAVGNKTLGLVSA